VLEHDRHKEVINFAQRVENGVILRSQTSSFSIDVSLRLCHVPPLDDRASNWNLGREGGSHSQTFHRPHGPYSKDQFSGEPR
jgi:hypothetical protein